MNHANSAGRRAIRPVLAGLETRELLSGIPKHPAIFAERAHPPQVVPTITQLASAPNRQVSTIPANGDVNPYGVAIVPNDVRGGGALNPGDVLVANYNSSANLQGTGTTIVRVTPQNQASVFFQTGPGFGLDTGLAVLKSGYVIVGNLPSADGTSATAGQGSILVIDRNGHQVAELTDANLLNGPWDLTVHDAGSHGQVFVSNALSGTVSRFEFTIGRAGGFKMGSGVQIASGYPHRGDPAAFELGPTGLAFNSKTDTLYVASTADNVIYAINNAGKVRKDHGIGRVVYADLAHLHGPLGLTFAPDGNLVVANGDAVNPDPNNSSTLVEFTKAGKFVGQISINPNAGGAFGVTSMFVGPAAHFAAVNDITNMLMVWEIKS